MVMVDLTSSPSAASSEPETLTGVSFQPGSATSSSGGSASSWERGETASAPTSDSESSHHWKSFTASGLTAADPTSMVALSAAMSEGQTDALVKGGTTSPPQSAVSGSPPGRTSFHDQQVTVAKTAAQHEPLSPNGINPHLSVAAEPFSPIQAQQAAKYPQTAAYARLLGPSRHDQPASNTDKRQVHDLSNESSQAAAEGIDYEQYTNNAAQTSSASASQRDAQSSLASGGGEDISTIFVVGFPDDLQEREFQNMFIFSPGFEAATLKIPPSQPREREQSQASRGQSAAAFPYDQDEDGAAPSTARKQIIGFAKFRTRAEAVDARNVLSGRKVDAEKGSVLKAEMAKKNLHTKRGLANDAVSGVGNPTGNASLQSLPALLAGMLQSQQLPAGMLDTAVTSLLRQDPADRDARTHAHAVAAYDAFHSLPAQSNASYAYSGAPTSPQTISNGRMGSMPAHTLTARQEYAALRGEGNARNDAPRGHASPRSGVSLDGVHTPPFAKSLMQQLDVDGDDLMAARNRNPAAAYQQLDANARRAAAYGEMPAPVYYSSPTEDAMSAALLRERMNSLNLVTQTPGLPMGIMSPVTSPNFPRTQNPADQNPPINTLYVGGLPAVQPSLVGPLSAAHLEECLRNAFQRCPGFRRLCFRQKSNGPMCFVEFDDVHYASRALSEMYGNTLSGLVKGGIRLSFSKNPLGVPSQRNGSASSGSVPLSPSSSSPYLPSTDPYMSGNTSPTPSAGSQARRQSDVSYYAASAAAVSNGARVMTPRSPTAQMPSLQGGMGGFSPFGYSSTGEI